MAYRRLGPRTLLRIALGASLATGSAHAAKIACIGDSITYGYGLSSPALESYPAQLQELLGAAHSVGNFGVSGATLMRSGDKPYWNEAQFTASDAFEPDIAIIALGTNDAKPFNWSKNEDFAGDYQELIDHYVALGAVVYIATPPHVFGAGAFDISPSVVETELAPAVRTVAAAANAPLIDLFEASAGAGSLFPDTVHPNAEGAGLLADAVYAALVATDFGSNSTSGGASSGGAANAGGAGTGGDLGPAVGGAQVSSGGVSNGGGPSGGTGFGDGGALPSGGIAAGVGGGPAAPAGGTPDPMGSGGATAGGATPDAGAPDAASGCSSAPPGHASWVALTVTPWLLLARRRWRRASSPRDARSRGSAPSGVTEPNREAARAPTRR